MSRASEQNKFQGDFVLPSNLVLIKKLFIKEYNRLLTHKPKQIVTVLLRMDGNGLWSWQTAKEYYYIDKGSNLPPWAWICKGNVWVNKRFSNKDRESKFRSVIKVTTNYLNLKINIYEINKEIGSKSLDIKSVMKSGQVAKK